MAHMWLYRDSGKENGNYYSILGHILRDFQGVVLCTIKVFTLEFGSANQGI